MTRLLSLSGFAALMVSGLVVAAPVAANPLVVQGGARVPAEMRGAAAEGRIMPLNAIVAEVQSQEPYRSMTYLGGPHYDAETMTYHLKFLDGTKVVVVKVDARNGRILSRS